MPYLMHVPVVHHVRVELQLRFPNADPAVLHSWGPADLVAAQELVDSYYTSGIRKLQRIDLEITRLGSDPAHDARRQALSERADVIRALLCGYLGIPPISAAQEAAA